MNPRVNARLRRALGLAVVALGVTLLVIGCTARPIQPLLYPGLAPADALTDTVEDCRFGGIVVLGWCYYFPAIF